MKPLLLLFLLSAHCPHQSVRPYAVPSQPAADGCLPTAALVASHKWCHQLEPHRRAVHSLAAALADQLMLDAADAILERRRAKRATALL